MSYADRILQAGFTLEVEDGHLYVEPFSRLSPEQVAFLKRYRDQIITELEAANQSGKFSASTLMETLAQACDGLDLTVDDLWRHLTEDDIEAIRQNPVEEWPALRCCAEIWGGKRHHSTPNPDFGQTVCQSPAGTLITIKPDNQAHAEWLQSVNPITGCNTDLNQRQKSEVMRTG